MKIELDIELPEVPSFFIGKNGRYYDLTTFDDKALQDIVDMWKLGLWVKRDKQRAY